MSGRVKIRWKSRFAVILIAAMAAFVISQILISTHAAKYGDSPHDHGGQLCVLSLVTPGADKLIVNTTFVLAVTFSFWHVADRVAQSERVNNLVRAASPRGPPNR